MISNNLDSINIRPNRELGQHFLVDHAVIKFLADQVNEGGEGLEVGAGDGRLTQKLLKKAKRVIAVEVDERYKSRLLTLSKKHSNLKVIMDDILNLNLNTLMKSRSQIISSLPYHISEPFLHKIMTLNIANAVLLVGNKLVRNSGKLSLLIHAFFGVELLGEVLKKAFLPVPRTDSTIIKLTPKVESDLFNLIVRELFLTASRGSLIKNVLKEKLIKLFYITQKQAKEKISDLMIDNVILNKSFDQLNNLELAVLSNKLKKLL